MVSAPTWDVRHGDCRELMAAMPAASVDAIVTDPPYGMAFMGKGWDHAVPGVEFWAEALRVAKPGAHLLAFGGTRTFHRLACAIEDAGWEIRDTLSWLYGSGFPKSHNGPWGGTALKPAWEPIIMARKPLAGTVAATVAAHGTGALNIDGCRIGTTVETWPSSRAYSRYDTGSPVKGTQATGEPPAGRWPANVALDEDAAAMLDAQSGESASNWRRSKGAAVGAADGYGFKTRSNVSPDDSGGASRFFYCAKASRCEREAGLDGQRVVYVSCPLWESADQKAKLRVDMGPSRPRVTAVSGAPCNDATVWSTFLFGSDTTAPYLTATTSTIGMATSSTTDSKTSTSFHRWLTSGYTEDVSGEAANGGSRVASAGRGTPSLTITSEWTVSARGVERAPSPTPFTISAGGSPADHPTVKPVALMRWLVRLVTPVDGVVLDPFTGSGTTGVAAVQEGRRFIGCEREAEYVEIARRRIAHHAPVQGDLLTGAA